MSESVSPAQLGAVRALRHMYGIEVPPYQMKVLAAALARLGGEGGVQAALERLLRRDSEAWDIVIDAITIPETYFFRHFPHFARLRELATDRLRRGRPCRVLSAGCSSGEEAWSAAAVLADVGSDRSAAQSVVGWDVNARRLIEASEGRYREWSVRSGLYGYDRFFERVGDHYRVSPSLASYGRFERVNLVGPLPEARFDAIFFRNVAIYFDPATARAVFGRLATLLEDDGMIFVGPSDPVTLPQDAWQHVIADGVRVYQRAARAAERADEASKAREVPSSRPTLAPHRPREVRPPRARRTPIAPSKTRPRAPRPRPVPAADVAMNGLAEVARLADQGAYAHALELLTSLGASSAEAAKWEGVLRLNLGEPAAAVDCLRRCVYLDPENVAYRRWLAVAYEAAGMNREAERERRNARELGAT